MVGGGGMGITSKTIGPRLDWKKKRKLGLWAQSEREEVKKTLAGKKNRGKIGKGSFDEKGSSQNLIAAFKPLIEIDEGLNGREKGKKKTFGNQG